MHEVHERILAMTVEALRRESGVAAALLQGSVARGDAHPGSDVDLLVLLDEGAAPAFRSSLAGGVRVEQHRTSVSALQARLEGRPGLAYGVLEARCLFDHAGVVPGLRDHARRALEGFRPPEKERAKLAYWLRTAVEKVSAAVSASDPARASLVATTTAWPLIEGLWMANGRPAPSAGAVLSRIGELPRLPPDAPEQFRQLLLGDASARAAAFLSLARWTADALEDGIRERIG
jgi:hypothetical protein